MKLLCASTARDEEQVYLHRDGSVVKYFIGCHGEVVKTEILVQPNTAMRRVDGYKEERLPPRRSQKVEKKQDLSTTTSVLPSPSLVKVSDVPVMEPKPSPNPSTYIEKDFVDGVMNVDPIESPPDHCHLIGNQQCGNALDMVYVEAVMAECEIDWLHEYYQLFEDPRY